MEQDPLSAQLYLGSGEDRRNHLRPALSGEWRGSQESSQARSLKGSGRGLLDPDRGRNPNQVCGGVVVTHYTMAVWLNGIQMMQIIYQSTRQSRYT